MSKRSYTNVQTTQDGILELVKALLLLSGGALLGLAVALPYERLLGLPASTKSVLGAAVWFVLIGAFQVDGKDAVDWEETLACFGARRNDSPRSEASRSEAAHVQPQRSCGILAFDTSGTC
jgi:hypothetical protein